MAQSIWKGAECAICLDEFEPGAKVMQLACHKTHLFHESCYLKYLQSNTGANALCPHCRTPIDKEKAKKVEITAPTPKVEDDDPFAAGANLKGQDEVVVSNPVAINEPNPDEPGAMPMVMAPGGDDDVDDLPPP